MKIWILCAVAAVTLMLVAVPGCADVSGDEPVCRKYAVEHPVYAWDDSVWGLVRTDADPDEWVGLSNSELRAHIVGGTYEDGDNSKLRGVLQVLARKYGETGDERYAYKAAVILHRYSEVLKTWGWYDRTSKQIRPHDYVEQAWDRTMPPRYAGMWSSWYPYDLHESAPLVLAYDQIYNSGQLEKLGAELGIADMKLYLEKELLYYNLSIDDRYPLGYGNTEANRILGMLTWGQALGDPELVHRAIRFGDNMIRISFFPSMFWHESSPGYHQMIAGRWASYGMLPILASYSDPEGFRDPIDGTRFDNANFRDRWWPQLEKAAYAMLNMVWPDGHYANINDADWTSNTTDRWDCYGPLDEYAPEKSEPVLMTWIGHAVLGQGEGEQQVQARLNFGGTNGHEHADRLNFFLWANGDEILSETQYGHGAVRAWTAMTAGHNTVVIDEQSQFNRSSAAQREFSDIDDMPGIEDYDWARMVVKHGSTLTDGQLRMFDTGGPNGLQVIEVDGQRAYPEAICQVYRRTLAMVQSSGDDVYFVDIFRVRGGNTHDWMLHGPLHEEYKTEVSLPLEPRDGTLHEWVGDLKSAETDAPWSVTFAAPGGQKIRTTMAAAPGTEVITGEAEAMRREGKATFLDVRRAGPENVFVAIHEPYTSEPKVAFVDAIVDTSQGKLNVVVSVDVDGRRDTFISGDGSDAADGDAEFAGRFAYLIGHGVTMEQGYLVDGSSLALSENAKVTGEAAWTGIVGRTKSIERGDAMNAFVTDAQLPVDGSLNGRLLLTEDGDGTTRGFFIENVTSEGGESVVAVDRLPGMTIEDGYVKQEYFPNWGIPGDLKFRISRSYTVRAE